MDSTLPSIHDAILLIGGVWLYYRGTLRASPVPTIKRDSTPTKDKPAKLIPPSAPRIRCPLCRKGPHWKASDDLTVWTCQERDCGETIPGPFAKIRA